MSCIYSSGQASSTKLSEKLHQMQFCRTFKGYEEVRVPAVKSGSPGADEKLVKIEDMEDWAQPAFQGYKSVVSTFYAQSTIACHRTSMYEAIPFIGF